MRVMFKRDLVGEKVTSIVEIKEAITNNDKTFIACLTTDGEIIFKFIPTKKLISGIISKAIFDLLTFGYFDFTHWDVYALYDVCNKEEWVAYHKEEES